MSENEKSRSEKRDVEKSVKYDCSEETDEKEKLHLQTSRMYDIQKSERKNYIYIKIMERKRKRGNSLTVY